MGSFFALLPVVSQEQKEGGVTIINNLINNDIKLYHQGLPIFY